MRISAEPAGSCVYTIRHKGALSTAEREGGGTWSESKTWRGASALLAKSVDDGTWLPVFFAAADRASGLLYVARLDSIELEHTNIDYTTYAFSNMIRFPQPPDISTLHLLETGNPLSSDFIRPYALCHTPMELLRSILGAP